MSRARPRKPQAAAGFSLLEVLAAFVLFSIAFAGVLQLLAASARNTRIAAEYTQAALWAQSLMDSYGVLEPLVEGSDRGRFDERYQWQIEVSRVEPEAPPTLQEMFAVDLFRIELVVFWGEPARQREARFVTLRASIPEPM